MSSGRIPLSFEPTHCPIPDSKRILQGSPVRCPRGARRPGYAYRPDLRNDDVVPPGVYSPRLRTGLRKAGGGPKTCGTPMRPRRRYNYQQINVPPANISLLLGLRVGLGADVAVIRRNTKVHDR